MHKVKNVIVLFLLALLLAGCSNLRRGSGSSVRIEPGSSWDIVKKAVERNNLQGEDFTFSRFKIRIVDEKMSSNASGFVKVKSDGRILVSIRSIAGIEVARGLISKDSVKVYDKINKVLYIQSQDYLNKKYGISFDILALAWGDIPNGFIEQDATKSSINNFCYILNDYGNEFQVCIDHSSVKLKSISGQQGSNGIIKVEYSGQKHEEGYFYPGHIDIELQKINMNISIELSGFKKEEIRNMKFSTGKVKDYIIIK